MEGKEWQALFSYSGEDCALVLPLAQILAWTKGQGLVECSFGPKVQKVSRIQFWAYVRSQRLVESTLESKVPKVGRIQVWATHPSWSNPGVRSQRLVESSLGPKVPKAGRIQPGAEGVKGWS